MYQLTDNGVIKLLESWHIIIPLYNNQGIQFKKEVIESILQDISLNFPGFSIVNIIGYWRNLEQVYIDKNLEIIIDTFKLTEGDSTAFFSKLKKELKEKLQQEKIYLTKEEFKKEFISFDEFFDEVGLEISKIESINEKKQLAKKLIQNIDFILQRLGYETTSLIRDKEKGKILWERKIGGILIKSEIDDVLPQDILIIPVDKIELLSKSINQYEPFAIIGDYEFQYYVLEKLKYRPLIGIEFKDFMKEMNFEFISPNGKHLSAQQFIEQFIRQILNNYLVLRDEGFHKNQISISVGRDGSLQRGDSKRGNILFHSPAVMPDQKIVKEIIKGLNKVIELYEINELDPITIKQLKAKNRYLFKRAFIRNTVKNK